MKKITHASVFSGIGGPEVAATMLGWQNLFHCEINPFDRAVLDYWFPNSKSYEDITKTDFTEWRGKVDVLTGGFPCQPFSYAGKRNVADTLRLETERRDASDTENDGSRGETRSAGESSERPHGQSDEQHSVGCCFWHVGPDDPRFAENGIAGCGRWADFPSVSPVHRGNDGLPFDVDGLTISFGKWRTEALKAYGNAIVVQVMYEIFRAIEIVENKHAENTLN